jgi:hypothetical protein
MILFVLSNLSMGAGPVPSAGTLVVFIDPRAAQLSTTASDSDPFGVDPRAAQLLATASDADPFGVDARSAQLIS